MTVIKDSMLARLQSYRVLPTLQVDLEGKSLGLDDLPPLLALLVEAQYPAIELLHRGPATWRALAVILKYAPELNIGVGTLTSEADLQRARDAGAHFGVSPGFHPSLVALAGSWQWPYLPGGDSQTGISI